MSVALHESLVAHPDVERLNRVRYAAGVGAAEKPEDVGGDLLISGHDMARAEYRVFCRRRGIQPIPDSDADSASKWESMESNAISGVVSLQGRQSVDAIVEKVKSILQVKNVKLFAVVDHSGEARNAGLKMPETKLLIFGNPAGGTPAMLAAPTLALDLPLKLLVWEDAGRAGLDQL